MLLCRCVCVAQLEIDYVSISTKYKKKKNLYIFICIHTIIIIIMIKDPEGKHTAQIYWASCWVSSAQIPIRLVFSLNQAIVAPHLVVWSCGDILNYSQTTPWFFWAESTWRRLESGDRGAGLKLRRYIELYSDISVVLLSRKYVTQTWIRRL